LRELDRRELAVRSAQEALEIDAPRRFHEMRKNVRRLRYALETVGLLAGASGPKALRRLVKAQDFLGRHQDRCLVFVHLERLGADKGVDLSAKARFLAGLLVAHEQNEARRLRVRFLDRRSALDRKSFRRVRRELKRTAAVQPPRAIRPKARRHTS
jgi:CHAD domain-containing protein